MYKEIYLEIPGEPYAKQSVRRGKWGSVFNPSKGPMDVTKTFLKSIYSEEILEGPLHVIFLFEMPIPSSWPKWKKQMAINGEIPHIDTPDVDNMQKFYGDCMSKIIYKDDSQIIRPDPIKYYSETPRTRIWIIPI